MHTRKRKRIYKPTYNPIRKSRRNTKHKGGTFIIHSTLQTRKKLPYTCEYIENKPSSVKKPTKATNAIKEEKKFAQDAIEIQNAMKNAIQNSKKDTENEINTEFAYLIQNNKKAKKELEAKLRENIKLSTTISSPKLARSVSLAKLTKSISSRFLQSPLDHLLSLTNLTDDEKDNVANMDANTLKKIRNKIRDKYLVFLSDQYFIDTDKEINKQVSDELNNTNIYYYYMFLRKLIHPYMDMYKIW